MPPRVSAREKAVTAALAAYKRSGDHDGDEFQRIDKRWDEAPSSVQGASNNLTPLERAHNAKIEKLRREWLRARLDVLLDIKTELDYAIRTTRSNLGWA